MEGRVSGPKCCRNSRRPDSRSSLIRWETGLYSELGSSWSLLLLRGLGGRWSQTGSYLAQAVSPDLRSWVEVRPSEVFLSQGRRRKAVLTSWLA